MLLNLVVIRARDVDALGRFYGALGLSFSPEQHGKGPKHLTCQLGDLVFEIYPFTSNAQQGGARIGFRVKDVPRQFMTALANGAEVITNPSASAWGERAVIRDPEGNVVELVRPIDSAVKSAG